MRAFGDICAAARAGDRGRLESLYQEHKTLNIQMGLTTPTEVLARGSDVSIDEADVITDESIARAVESNIRAVALLFEFSREKDFNFDILGAFRGAGVAGGECFDALLKLIKKELSSGEFSLYLPEIYLWAIQGAARAGNFDLLDRLQQLLGEDGFDPRMIGAAQGGQFTYVRRHRGYAIAKLLGAARGGRTDFVKQLIQQMAAATTASDRAYDLDEAISGAAAAGYAGIVSYLIGEGASKDRAVMYAAEGGHYNLVRQLIGEGANKDLAAYGAGSGGHFVFACELVQDYGASEDEATGGAAMKWESYLKKALKAAFNRKPEAASVPDERTSLFSSRSARQSHRAGYGATNRFELTETGGAEARIGDVLIDATDDSGAAPGQMF